MSATTASCGSAGKIDVERLLAGHAEARGVDEQTAACQRAMRCSQSITSTAGPKACGQRFGAAARAVGEENLRVHRLRPRPCRIARAAPPAPSTITGRRPSFQSDACFIEIGHEAVGVGVAGAKPPGLVEPQRVGGADRPRRLVGHRRQLERGFLVRQRDIGAGKALRCRASRETAPASSGRTASFS